LEHRSTFVSNHNFLAIFDKERAMPNESRNYSYNHQIVT
jgi:hypothetical protein